MIHKLALVTVLGALLVTVLVSLSACASDGGLTPQGRAILTASCLVDQIAQPVAVAIVGVTAPEMASATAAEAIVHQAVIRACAQIGGAPAP